MTGYPRKRRRASPACLLIVMSAFSAHALATEETLPGMELLEFLADWETPDGEWVDPLELDTPEVAPAGNADPEVPHE